MLVLVLMAVVIDAVGVVVMCVFTVASGKTAPDDALIQQPDERVEIT